MEVGICNNFEKFNEMKIMTRKIKFSEIIYISVFSLKKICSKKEIHSLFVFLVETRKLVLMQTVAEIRLDVV